MFRVLRSFQSATESTRQHNALRQVNRHVRFHCYSLAAELFGTVVWPYGPEYFDFCFAQWKDMIPAMLREDSNLAAQFILECERMPEENKRTIGKADGDALVTSKIAGREAIAVLTKVLPNL